MSALKKKLLYPSPSLRAVPKPQEDSRKNKLESEALRDQLQKRIIDNPKAAQKAALIITHWINKTKP
jgi:hypothetical protein